MSRWAARLTVDLPRVQKLFSNWMSGKRPGARGNTRRSSQGSQAEAAESGEHEEAGVPIVEVEQDDDDDDDPVMPPRAAAHSGAATSSSSSSAALDMFLDLTLDEVLGDEDAGAESGDDA